MAAKKVTFMVGMIPFRCKIEVAVDEESSGLHTVCTGPNADAVHEPARVKASIECPSCGRTHSSVWGFTQRGYEEGDKVIVVDSAALAAAQGAPRTGRTEPVDIVWHRREKVFAATVAGDSVQNVFPDKGGEKVYEVLRDTLLENPDIVGTMIWAPTSKNSLWVLEVVGERLVASKRAWPEYVRPTITLPRVDGISDAERSMFAQFITGAVEDFDLGRYVDESKLGRDELLAKARTGAVPIAAPVAAARANATDLLAGLQASLASLGAKPTPVKKAPAKKAVAKKTTTRKPVAKKAPAKRAASKKAAPKEVAA